MLASMVSGEENGLQMLSSSYIQLVFLYVLMEKERASSLVCLLIRALILLDQDLTLMILFNLNYFLRSFISKYSRVGG